MPRVVLAFVLTFSAMLVVCPAIAGEKSCSATANALPLCTVLARPAQFDGQDITVTALYRMVIHGSILTSPDCGDVNLRGASDYTAEKRASQVIRSAMKRNQFQAVKVVLKGTFHVAHEGQCFGQDCLQYEVEDHALLCAEKPSSVSSASPRR